MRPTIHVHACLLFAFTLLTQEARAAESAHVKEAVAAPGAAAPFVCVGNRVADLDLSKTHPEWEGCDTIGADPATTQSNPDHVSDVHGGPGEFVLVRARGTSSLVHPAADGEIQQVVVSAGTVTITRVATAAISHDGLTVEVPLSDLSVLDNGDVATVRIDYVPKADGTRRASDTSYFTLKNSWSWYGLASSGIGVWIPLGLFASNFKATNDGIPFAAFPVGLAVGGRIYVHNSFYIGPSLMVNYAIYSSTQAQVAANANASQTVNLQSGAVGGLLDVGGYIYLGGAYLADFRKDGSSPGAMFVVGVGPQLLQFLQAAKK